MIPVVVVVLLLLVSMATIPFVEIDGSGRCLGTGNVYVYEIIGVDGGITTRLLTT